MTATFNANYNGTDPMTGTVAFYDGTTFLGTATLSSVPPKSPPMAAISPAVSPAMRNTQVSGQATLPNVILTVGDHNIRAVYSGDANYAAVTSDHAGLGGRPAGHDGHDAGGRARRGGHDDPDRLDLPDLARDADADRHGRRSTTATRCWVLADVVSQVATFNAGVLRGRGAQLPGACSPAAPSRPPAVRHGGLHAGRERSDGGEHPTLRPQLQPTYLMLTFSGTLDPVQAENVKNYQLVKLNRRGKPRANPVLIKVASINSAAIR